MHTAVIIPTDRQFLKHDLFRQKTVTIIAAAKWDTSPFVILDAFVKHQQLKLPVLEQPARTDTVQPEIGHQQGERLVQLQAAFKNVHFSAERRIRYYNIPTIRLVSKKNPVRYLYASILPEIRLPADEARTRCGTCQKGTI